MRYLHTMIRVLDLPAALRFFCEGLGLEEVRRSEHPQGRYTLVFLASRATPDAQVELTHNWDQAEPYTGGRNFGHLAFEVDDIYAACARMRSLGYLVSRPPRDGRMAFIRSPDRISVELLQKPPALAPAEPWVSMPNSGEW
jgi:lactoylglutathione lyase